MAWQSEGMPGPQILLTSYKSLTNMALNQKKAVIFGETKLCTQCAEFLLADGWTILAIISDDAVVIHWADRHSIKCFRFFQLAEIYEDNFYLFSIINPYIIPQAFLKSKNIHLALNYHDSLLPKYAGINSTTWAIINGETRHGVTLHEINAGIDEGRVVEQVIINIEADETAFSLDLKCSEQVLILFQNVITKISNNALHFTPQSLHNRSYYGLKHIPPNYAVINGIKDVRFLDRLIRGLEFGEEKNPVATVKVYSGCRFYIVENAILTEGSMHFSTIRNIYGEVINGHMDYTTCPPYVIHEDDLHYIKKIKSVERQAQKKLMEISTTDALFSILGKSDINNRDDIVSTTLLIPKDITQSTALAIIHLVLIRYFHESFIVSLYTTTKDIPDSLINLVEKRKFIALSKELLKLNILQLEKQLNDCLENSPTIVKDFFYRYKLQSDTDIAVTIGRVQEMDQHKLTIILDPHQITIKCNGQYQLQANSLIECIETVFSQKDVLLHADLAKINMLSIQQYKLLYEHNPKLEFPQNKTIHQLFEEQVLKTPNNIAVVYGDTELTYRELNTQANQLATYLINTYKISKDTLITLCLDRSEYMLIAILGVLKSGGAYVPIEPSYPQNRIAYIISDTQSQILITNKKYEDSLSFLKITIFAIDAEPIQATLKAQSEKNPTTDTISTDLAYVIYTSGTTGKPNGVLQQHNNVMRLFKATEALYGFNDRDIWVLFHSYVFDFSIWEMCGALMYGGKLIIPSIKHVKDTSLFYALCYEEKVTVLNQTPKFFYQFIETALEKFKYHPLDCLRYVIFGGDVLQAKTLENWFNLYGYERPILINMYGITETTIHVTYKKINSSNITTCSYIGSPIPDMQVFILDNNYNAVPVGGIGELYIGGAGLARGYLNKPELTTQRFIPYPLKNPEQSNSSRLYKTGDLVRMLSDGDMEYIGRNDFQVKIKGYRIELGEIENTLINYPGIKQVVVLAKAHINHDSYNNFQNKYLIAYYVASGPLLKRDIKHYLKNKLPEYMIPLYFVHVQQLPLTINGKLDINALPDRLEDIKLNRHIEPKNIIQAKICLILAEILNIDIRTLNIDDDFFNLGGDSILAIRLVSRINRTLNSDLKVYDIYKLKTIINLSEFIQKNSNTLVNISEYDDIERSFQSEKYIPYSLVDLNKFSGINLDEIEDIYPASYLQMGMLLESELYDNDGTYHDVFYYQINYAFDKKKFIDIWKQLITKHPLLRAKFIFNDTGKWNLVVLKNIEVTYVLHKSVELKKLVETERLNPFNYQKAGLFRLIINQHDSGFDLVFSFCHVIADGWSIANLINEFVQAYVYNIPIITLINNPNYALFVKCELNALRNDDHITFWRDYLTDMHFTSIKWKFDDNNTSKDGLFTSSIILTSEESKLTHELAKLNAIGVDNIFIYAYLKTLSFFLNDTDLTIGLVVNNRPEIHGGDQVFGLFLNTIPYRFNLDNKKTVNETLGEIFSSRLQLSKHKHLPYGRIKSEYSHELYQFAFIFINFHNLKASMKAITKIGGFEKANIPFIFNVYQQNDSFKLEFKAHDSYVEQQYLDYILKYVKMTLINIISNKNQIYLDAPDYSTLVYKWNQTEKEYPRNKTLQQIFEQQVFQNPKDIAIVFEDKKLSYQDLNNKANQLAHYLRTKYSVREEDLIALCLGRDEFMIITILAVLKSGAAYVPIEPNYPEERIKFILEDTKTKVLIINHSYKEKLVNIINNHIHGQSKPSLELIDTVNMQAQLASEPANNLITNVTSHNLAYVMYTSGTIGNPKGVMIEHKSAINTIVELSHIYQSTKGNRVSEFTSYAFDISVSEIFSTFLNGGELHLLSEHVKTDVIQLKNYLIKNKINVTYLPPALLVHLEKCSYDDLDIIIYGGEPCDKKTGEYWSTQKKLYNYYGPTEASIYCSGKLIINGDVNLIGKPIANVYMYILDPKDLTPKPIGAIGELCIGGINLARGYLNLPELTTEKFVRNPFQNEKGSRLYKTGDLARYLPDGNIEYIGRSDSQIKLRGYRIELSEIQIKLEDLPQIKQAIAVLKENKRNNEKYLAAYYLADEKLNEEELSNYLSARLPEYMVPFLFIHIAKIPLTFNGKIDYKSLPDVEIKLNDNLISPKNDTESIICKIYAELLNLPEEKIGINSDFFRLGGNSILAIKLLVQLNNIFNSQLKPVDIFSYRTTQRLAQLIITESKNFKLITPLNITTEKPNLFMIHPAFAGSEVYTALAQTLSNHYSCFGIDNYNLHHKDKILNINKLASYYIDEMDKIRKITNKHNEPYLLLGWSLGGQIAFEMAAILEQNGVKNIKVALLDAIIADSKLAKYLSNLEFDKDNFYNFLKTQGYLEEYINKIIANFFYDIELARQKPKYKLKTTKFLLFKAMQLDERECFTNYNSQNAYEIRLKYNNLDRWTGIKNIKIIKINHANHFSIIEQYDIISKHLCLDLEK